MSYKQKFLNGTSEVPVDYMSGDGLLFLLYMLMYGYFFIRILTWTTKKESSWNVDIVTTLKLRIS